MHAMKHRTLALAASCGAIAGFLALEGCSGGAAGDRANRGPFKVNQITTGGGQIFPYRIRQADAFGNPTSTVLNIEDIDVLKSNVGPNNPVLPVAAWPTTATLPNGASGNHFLLMRFSHRLNIGSILSNQLANQTNSGLTTSISLLAYNPATESTSVVKGRGFVGGYTYFNRGGTLELVQAVKNDNGEVRVLDAEANGFPRGFSGDVDLVEPSSFVFVADSDDNLASLETFPNNVLFRIVVSNAVRDTEDHVLSLEVCTASTVGGDTNPPNVLGYSGNKTLEITPGNNQQGVDPTTAILVRFNKPVQPQDVGAFLNRTNLTPPAGGMSIGVTQAAKSFNVTYYADPVSYADFCNYLLTPAYNLPGESDVVVSVQNTRIRGVADLAMTVGQPVSTPFKTGIGPAIVNAPVAPDAIYVGIGGAQPGVSVIDLNGYGQGTGDPATSRFTLNPNLPSTGIYPPLGPGNSRLDAGSSGALTLVQDTSSDPSANTRLLRPPLVGSVGDIHIGAPLDLVFNNENINPNASRANALNPVTFVETVGNSITVAPHPNPPRLVFPPPNESRAIFGEEPTMNSSIPGPYPALQTQVPPCQRGPLNQLKTGNPFATRQGEVGIFGHFVEGIFYGPQPPPPSPPPPLAFCPFMSRQQVGHFLYVLDRDNRQVLVLNSNRFTVLDRIRMTDPISMAMSPNLRHLAVTNGSSASVSIIDINPLSSTFHQVIVETRVEKGPTGVAFQPDGEDLFVVSSSANVVTILSALDFQVRRTVQGFLNNPIDVAVTNRYFGTGYNSATYYAFILNANGTVAVYESGPFGVNGIGFDDVIGTITATTFSRARSITLDYNSGKSGFFVGHVDEQGLGQISRVDLIASPIGQLPIQQNQGGFIFAPDFRQKTWGVVQRFGGLDPQRPGAPLLSGNAPVDIAVDEMFNVGGAQGQGTPFNGQVPAPPWLHSDKAAVKALGPALVAPFVPKLMFIALGDVGKVDIFEIDSGKKLRSIDIPGVRVVSSYWRQ